MRSLGVMIGLGAALSASPAPAEPVSAGVSACGGDAFSSAEVTEHRPARRGPVTAVPNTLCADVTPQQPPTRVDIYAVPVLDPENGAGRGGAPYDGRPRRGGPPRP